MSKISRVLCVIDPTSEEQHAFERAAWIAGCLGADLELFICYYNEYLSGDRFFDSPSLAKARDEVIAGHRRRLEELAGPLLERGMTVTTAAVWDHPLYEGIVRHAHRSHADLIVKDTHHHSAASSALLSNTDWQLIRNCAEPLWLVKPRPLSAHPTFVAAIDPMNSHDKPAALDDEIIAVSKQLADAGGGEVRAFHAYDPRMAVATATTNAYLPVSLPLAEIDEQMREQHGKRFREIASFHEIPAERTHLASGLTHEELPAIAGKYDADVVVMGAVARNRWKRLFIGATAERTLEQLPCDLLIVKPDWFQVPDEILKYRNCAA